MKSSILAFALKIMAGVSSYLMFVLLSINMNSETYASFGVNFSIAMMFGLLANAGQLIFIVKNVFVLKEEGSDAALESTLSFSLFSNVIGILVSMVLLGLMNIFSVIGIEFILPLFLFSSIFSISQTLMGTLRVVNKVNFSVFTRDVLWRIFTIIIVYFFSIDNKLDQISALYVLSLSLIPIIILHFIIISKSISLSKFKLNIKVEWVKISFGLTLVALISSSDLYLFTIIASEYLNSEEQGAFFSSLKTVELMNLFLMAITLIISPVVSSYVAAKKTNKLQQILNAALVFQGIPALFSTIFLSLTAAFILNLFDSAFSQYSGLLVMLALGTLFNALTGPTVLLMQLAGLHWRQILYQGGSLLIALISMPFLIGSFGYYGAALSFILSKIIWNILAVYEIRKKIDVDPSILGVLYNNSLGFKGLLKNLKTILGRDEKVIF